MVVARYQSPKGVTCPIREACSVQTYPWSRAVTDSVTDMGLLAGWHKGCNHYSKMPLPSVLESTFVWWFLPSQAEEPETKFNQSSTRPSCLHAKICDLSSTFRAYATSNQHWGGKCNQRFLVQHVGFSLSLTHTCTQRGISFFLSCLPFMSLDHVCFVLVFRSRGTLCGIF